MQAALDAEPLMLWLHVSLPDQVWHGWAEKKKAQMVAMHVSDGA